MEEKRCYGCMEIKSGESVCEHCGYDDRCKNETHQLAAGTILKEQYLIGRVLGQGGFGITYLGWDMYLDIPVAVKEYFPNAIVMRDVTVSTDVVSCSGDAGVRFRNNKERFMREAKMLARFSQVPQIVQVRNFFLANNTAYIVMEYVDGTNLKQVVKAQGGRLSFEQTFEIMGPVMEALCKVHQSGLVHRDISPDNIMILPDGTAKLLDFGAVRDVGGADVNSPLSQSTEAILKQGYAPIEQYQNRGSLGPWTDVYALCATIYYCLTGEVPMDAPGRLLDDEEISFENLGLSDKEIQALQKGMALRANDRVRSVDELLKLLTLQNTDDPIIVIDDDDPIIVINDDEKKKHLKALLIAGLAIIAVTLLFVILQSMTGKAEVSEEAAAESNEGIVVEEEAYTGQCGENAYYTFDAEAKVLYITGSGDMYDYNGRWQENPENADSPLDPERTFAPWTEFGEEVYSVFIEDGITSIGENAFENCDNLQDVRFGKDIKRIGFQAFLATGIREAVLPEGLEEISGCAFNYCWNLEKVVLPESLTMLEGWTFNECSSLCAVIVGDQTEIREDAFHCEAHEDLSCLAQLVLYVTPGSTAEQTALETGYGDQCREKAAGWCGEHTAWYVDLDERCLYIVGWGGTGVYQIGDGPIEDWLESASEEWISRGYPEWISWYSNKIEKIVVGRYVTHLNHRLFNGLIYLKEVDLGGAQYACALFDGCTELEEVILPETLEYIDWNMFANCEKLRRVEFLGENLVITNGVFENTPALEEVYFSKGAVIDDVHGDLFSENYGLEVSPNVTFYIYEGSDAERYAKKYNIAYEIREEEAVTAEDGTALMGQCGDDIRWSFDPETKVLTLEGTGQTWIYGIEEENRAQWERDFPNEWIYAEKPEFVNHEIHKIVIGDGITHLNHGIFNFVSFLKEVDFGSTVEVVDFVFWWCRLEEIVFPENIKAVGTYALAWNQKLTKVVFECDDVEIGRGALAACNRLEEVYLPRNASLTDDIIDPDGNDPYSSNLTFYVYEGSKAHEQAQWYVEKYGVKIAFREE